MEIPQLSEKQSIKSRHFLRACSGPLTITATFLVLTVWTWRKWPDILVDFGRELYVPWQLATGKTLYSDLGYFNGPFSPYLNALWFSIFGVSFTTIIFCNLAILAFTTGMIYRMFSASCDRLTGTACCVVFLCVFGFGQLTETGNYNFVSPYSHELTHGIALSTGMILCLRSYSLKPRRVMAFLAGLLLGLVFLTKAEVFLAALAAGVFGMANLYLGEPESRQRTVAAACLGAGGILLSIGLTAVFLGMRMPMADAFNGVLGTWGSLFGSDVTSNIFYLRNAGLDQPVSRLINEARASVGLVLLVSAIVAADALVRLRSNAKALAIGTTLTLFVLSCLAKQSTEPWLDNNWFPVPWLMLGAALPFVSLSACAGFLAVGIRGTVAQTRKLLPVVMWAVFALVLLVKIVLSARVYHYGFALAMPAMLILVGSILHFVPSALRRFNGGGDVFRRFALAMLIADTLFFLKVSNGYYSSKKIAVGTAGDVIFTAEPRIDPRGTVIARALRRIDELAPPGATLMVLPEGIMLNYLSRRQNPTPYINFMPPEMAIFGEGTMLSSIQKRPPDFIVLATKDTGEYGVGPFGLDPNYGRQIVDWVKTHYAVVDELSAESSTPRPFQITILKRAFN